MEGRREKEMEDMISRGERKQKESLKIISGSVKDPFTWETSNLTNICPAFEAFFTNM